MIEIFVFGSNLAGRHGRGAALSARTYHGAIYGQGVGLQGNSYAIPTKDMDLATLPLGEVEKHVMVFKEFAKQHPEYVFRITPIGCGLAGYEPSQIGPMFNCAPKNCVLPVDFLPYVK